jgi:hypothetical protein
MCRRFVDCIVAVLLMTGFGMAQLPAQDARGSVQAALGLLAPNRQLPADLILTGQLAQSSGVVPFRITIKGKDQVRYEIGSGASQVVTTHFKGVAWREGGGKRQMLEPYTAVQRATLLPFLDLLGEADAPSLQVTDRGLFSLGAASARRFTLKLPDPSPKTRMFGRALDEETDFYMDAATGLVLRSERWLLAENSMNVRFRAITEFADYRLVQGFAIPFRIVSSVVAPSRSTPSQAVYTITNVTINSGIADLATVETSR